MYSQEVQDFIERHIDLIDTEDWDQLLRFTMTPYDEDYLTDKEVQELIDCLAEAGILIKGETRLRILFDIIKEALEIYFNNETRGNVVYFINHYMENTLGLSKAEAVKFIHMNEEDLNIMCDENGTVLRRDID